MSELDTNPEALVEQGLQLYSQGRLEEALDRWQAALAIAPEHNRAREYLRYVEDNRTALEESFRLARGASGGSGGGPGAGQQPSTTSRAQTLEIEEIEEIGAIELEEDAAGAGKAAAGAGEAAAGRDFQGASASNDALTRKMNLLSKPPADQDEYTPRIDLAELKDHVAESRRRLSVELPPNAGPNGSPEDLKEAAKRSLVPTPSRLTDSIQQGSRRRKETPLIVIEGGGERASEEFDPADLTPVRTFLPEPSRLLRSEGQQKGADQDEVPASSSARYTAGDRSPAPSSLGLASAGEPSKAGRRLTPLPAAQQASSRSAPAGPDEKKNTATPARGFYSEPRGETDLPGPITPTGAKQVGQQENMLGGARQLFEQGTYEGSLWLCERVLTSDPEHPEAKELFQQNREILIQQYRREIGDFSRAPVVLVPQHEIVWHKLDHRAGFLLSRIDGLLSYDDLLDVSSMSEFEACRILAQLRGQGIIGSQS